MKRFNIHFKAIVTATLIFVFSTLNAQQIEYSVTESNPHLQNFVIKLKLVDFECGLSDVLRYSMGVEGDYYFGEIGAVNLSLNKTLFGTANMDAGTFHDLENTITTFSMYEAGGRFYFSNKIGKTKGKVVVSSEVTYSGTKETYFKAQFPARKIMALRAGIFNSNAPVNTNWNKMEGYDYGFVETKSGYVAGGKYSQSYTMMHNTGFYGGLSLMKIANAQIKYGTRTASFRYMKDTYFDMLYSPMVSFSPFQENGQDHEVIANAENSFNTSDLGWRIGTQLHRTKKHTSVMFGLEAGSRPFIKNRGAYFTSKVAIALNSKKAQFN